MKCIFSHAATAIIAVLLAPLFSETHFLPWNNSCLQAHTVHADTRGISATPSLVLWAWERPKDLRFLHPTRAGVAFSRALAARPERNELPSTDAAAPGASGYEIGCVVRIETTAGVVFKNETAKRVAQEIAQAADYPRWSQCKSTSMRLHRNGCSIAICWWN